MIDDRIIDMILDRFNTRNPDTGIENRIVFWADPGKEFADDIDELRIEGITVLKWDGYNAFKIKVMTEYDEPESKFLIYMPCNIQGNDQYDILADMKHYSKPFFSADSASCICQELNIPDECKLVVKGHIRFFKSAKNKTRFLKYDSFKDEDGIRKSMIATLISSDGCDTDSIMIALVSDYLESPEKCDKATDALNKNNLFDYLLDCCRTEYGFNGTDIEEFVRDLFITAAFHSTEVSTSPKLKPYVMSRDIRAVPLMKRISDNSDNRENLKSVCDEISGKYGIPTILNAYDVDMLMDCGVFPCVDTAIIDRMMGRILSIRSPLDGDEEENIRKRIKMNRDGHFTEFYNALLSASDLLRRCNNYRDIRSAFEDAGSILSEYSSNLYRIDTQYRHFIKSMDSAPVDSGVSDDLTVRLCDYVEDTYCNIFLDPIVSDLCSSVKEYKDFQGIYQQGFFNKFIDGDRKTAVIISDAFRYECAAELYDVLEKTSKVEKLGLKYMISTVPSKTSFGMAALLPNNGLEVKLDKDGNFSVLIDGQSTEASNRERILQSYCPESAVMKYDLVKDSTVSSLRSVFAGKKLIYIYHDAIDKTGESDERNVFSACERSINDLRDLILRLTSCNCTNFIITADHGFIYRRGEIKEYDKISTADGFNSKRRFALNDRRFGLDRCVEFSLDYLGDVNKDLYVSVPNSIALFRRQGSAKCFAHEGISPQEIVVPVLSVGTTKNSVAEVYVGLKPGNKRDVKQFKPKFELWQEHAVDDTYRKSDYEVWLEDDDGKQISQIYTVIADSEDASDLRQNITMNEELKANYVTLAIRRKGESEAQRFEGFRVKGVGFI